MSAAIKQMFQRGNLPISADTLTMLLNKKKVAKKPKPFSINRTWFKAFADKLPDARELENLFTEFFRAKLGLEA